MGEPRAESREPRAARPDTQHEVILRDLVAFRGGVFCERCRCCEMHWRECEHCVGEGIDGHDCGEDTCCCLDPTDNMTCDVCMGNGGWWCCGCDESGQHPQRATVPQTPVEEEVTPFPLCYRDWP